MLDRSFVPAAVIACTAVVLHAVVLTVAPRVGTDPADRISLGRVDYALSPLIAIPRLEATFVAKALGRVLSAPREDEPQRPVPARALDSTPRPATPRPAATPAPAPGLIDTGRDVRVSFSADRTAVRAGEFVIYSVLLSNPGAAEVTATVSVTTHTPLGTAGCTTTSAEPVCVVPGDYDGSSESSDDTHVNPAVQERVSRVPPGESAAAYRLRVRVSESTLAGTVLHNHAHVDVVSDGKPAVTYRAQDVVVR